MVLVRTALVRTSVPVLPGEMSRSLSLLTSLPALVQAVPDFTTSCNPSSLTIVPGSQGYSTFIITSVAGLAGTATFSALPTPRFGAYGLATSMTLSQVNLPANGTAMSTLNVTVDDFTAPRTYNVTVTVAGPLGPGGGLPTRSTVVQVVVSSPSNTGGILLYETVSAAAVALVVVGATLYFSGGPEEVD